MVLWQAEGAHLLSWSRSKVHNPAGHWEVTLCGHCMMDVEQGQGAGSTGWAC